MITFLLIMAALYVGGTAIALCWFYRCASKEDEADEAEFEIPVPAVYPARREVHIALLAGTCAECAKSEPSILAEHWMTCTASGRHVVNPGDWCVHWAPIEKEVEHGIQ